MVEGKNAKRAILLFTDGVDNASHLSSLEMAEILQQVSTPVYAVGIKNAAFDRLTDQEREELALDNLKMLAVSSGGQMYLAAGRRTCGRSRPGSIRRSGNSTCWALHRPVRAR